jgi:putative ABC transport system permease protein
MRLADRSRPAARDATSGERDDSKGGAIGFRWKTLDRKLVRELLGSWVAFVAIATVVAAGVSVFVMALSVLEFLDQSRERYYDRYRFADVFAELTRAPNHLADSIATIPGVAAVDTRVSGMITLEVPGLNEPATAKMLSLGEGVKSMGDDAVSMDRNARDAGDRKGLAGSSRVRGLNGVHLVSGRWPDPEAADEVVASEAFVEANGLRIGSELAGVLQGRSQRLRIVGVGLSPEYVFQIRGGDFLPDNRRFAVLWGTRRQMEAAFDMEGAFNNLSVLLVAGASPRPVIRQIDLTLRDYGGLGAYGREDQLSARFLDDEISQLRATGLIVPAIFLGVAAFLLNLVFARRVELQRESIATLKAFGYEGWQVAWHFVKFALVVAVGGSIIGAFLGWWLAQGLCGIYANFFRFPTFDYRLYPGVIVWSGVVSVIAAVGGVLATVARVLRLQPAEAMRPAVPPRYTHGWADGVCRHLGLSTPWKMVVRRLARRPVPTALAAVGIGLATAVLLVSRFTLEAVDSMIDYQFNVMQRQDLQVTFREAMAPAAVDELRQLDGVRQVEPFRAIPVRLRNGQREKRVSVLAIGTGPRGDVPNRLFRLLDSGGLPIRIAPGGLALTDKLAELLGVTPGDRVEVEVLEGRRQRFSARVLGVAKENLGTNAYATDATLHRWLQEDRRASGVFLKIDADRSQAIYDALRQYPEVIAVSARKATLESGLKTMRESHGKMEGFTTAFAAVIALGVVYNMARLTMAEQSRELATMRVIGFTRWEVSMVFLGEVLLVTLIAIPIGWLVGWGFCWAIVWGIESDLYRIPMAISRHSYLIAGGWTMLAAMASAAIVRGAIDRLDLVSVMKDQG